MAAGLQDMLTHEAGDAAALRCFRPLPQLIGCLQLLCCIVCIFFLQYIQTKVLKKGNSTCQQLLADCLHRLNVNSNEH